MPVTGETGVHVYCLGKYASVWLLVMSCRAIQQVGQEASEPGFEAAVSVGQVLVRSEGLQFGNMRVQEVQASYWRDCKICESFWRLICLCVSE